MTTSYVIANTAMQVVLVSIVITSIFFLYASQKIEPKVVTSQIKDVITQSTGNLKLILTPDQQNTLSGIFGAITPPDMSNEDAIAASTNSALMIKAIIALSILAIIGFLIVGGICWKWKVSFWELLKDNFLAVIVVATIEIGFVSYFALNYRTLDANMVLQSIIQGLQSYAAS